MNPTSAVPRSRRIRSEQSLRVHHQRVLQIVELAELGLQIGAPLALEAIGGWPVALRGRLAVAAEEPLRDVEFTNASERRVALAVEPGVVAQVDDQLRAAREWPAGEAHHAAVVGLL